MSMVFTKNHVMSVEFAKKAAMDMSNISMAKKELEELGNFTCIMKIGQGTYINKKSTMLPKYIREGLTKHTFSNLENKIPITYLEKTWDIKKLDLKSLLHTNPEIVKGISTIEGVEFIEFNVHFANLLDVVIPYILSRKEFFDCHKKGLLDGHVELNSGKYLVWYYV